MPTDRSTTWLKLHTSLRETLLGLPRPENYRFGSVSEMYGAGFVAAQYCGLAQPLAVSGRTWQHGWVSPGVMKHPLTVTMGQGDKRDLHLVSRSDEADFLRRHGYSSEAIGLPFAYALQLPFEAPDRIPGSVLVLPSHSSRLKLVNDAAAISSFAKYVLASEAPQDRTVVCLHDEDMRVPTANSVWHDFNFALVGGAAVDDAAALIRMRYLFNAFETVLTDQIGSSIPMALACGARLAIYDRETTVHYQSLAEERHEKAGVDPQASRGWIIKTKPELLAGVNSGVRDERWGLNQLGHSNIVSPDALISALGWHPEARRSRSVGKLGARVFNRFRHLF